MNKIARLLIRRLERAARQDTCRNAHRNGLLEMKIIEIGGHVLRRYSPVFDTSRLSGNAARDLAWLRWTYAAHLMSPPRLDEKETKLVRRDTTGLPDRPAEIADGRIRPTDHASRAYAVALVGRAGRPPLVSNIAAVLMLVRMIESNHVSFSQVVRVATMSAPVIALHAPVIGFESAFRRLIETPNFLPGLTPSGIDGDYVIDDRSFSIEGDVGRLYIQFMGRAIRSISAAVLQRRLSYALTRDYSVVALAESAAHIPSDITIAADLNLSMTGLDIPFVRLMMETVFGAAGLEALSLWQHVANAHYLTFDDVVLAFRPGRSAPEVVSALASLSERNRIKAKNGDGDEEKKCSGSSSKSKADATSGKSSGTCGGWKRDKPSGAEVIQPEPLGQETTDRPTLIVERLSGYGRAKTWALDLKADLSDFCEAKLAWSEMSTKLLLSGPPGTGKTMFARALCNTLKIPLVATSVSTWLQGGHLNDVIDKMSKTFDEARAIAPAILFIDEIDGIGKRQPSAREYAEYWNAIINKALELLDGAVKTEGLVIVGATNRPEQIDDALKRSGRLETHIEIPKPDILTLVEIFAHHLGEDLNVLVPRVGTECCAEAQSVPQGAGQ